MSLETGRSRVDLVSAIVLAAFGGFTLIFGVWAMVDPHSFYTEVATFPPENKHLLHDVGAFQIGVGAALLLALVWRGDAMLAALGGGAAGATAHEIAHIADSDLGGRDSDAISLGIIAAILVVTFLWRLRWRYRAS